MANKTTIKSDSLGLYITIGGYICRPFFGTIFKEGDTIKTHNFGGTQYCGVTFNQKDFNFKGNSDFELWITTITSQEYKQREIKSMELLHKELSFDDYLKTKTEQCKNFVSNSHLKWRNQKFKTSFNGKKHTYL